MRLFRTLLLATTFGALTAISALAAGSGGGGASEAPSASAPSYDPAEEYQKALKALQARDYKAAARAAKNVTDAVPKSADAWRLLGVASAGSENWKTAKRAYERAVKLLPDDSASHAGLGIALGRLQDPKAQAELDWLKAKAAACGAGCADAGNLTMMTREVEAAVAGAAPKPSAALERGAFATATAEAGDAAYVQAVSLINEHRYDEALASLDRATRVFGPHPDLITYQGYAWRKKGQFDRAEAYYREALAIAPDHRGATEYYGELKVERGDMAGAKVMLAKLDHLCAYGCAEAEELRRWINIGGDPAL